MILGILFVLLFAYSVESLWKDTKKALRKWRGSRGKNTKRVGLHDVGFWLHQLAHGFPTARHGFMSGWHRGRQAHHTARTGMAQARAEHAEQRVQRGPELAEYRQRRRKALAELDRQRYDEDEEDPELGPPQLAEAPAYVGPNTPEAPPASASQYPLTLGQPEHAGRHVRREQLHADPDPRPEDPALVTPPEPAQPPVPAPGPAPTQGDAVSETETTYASVKARMAHDVATAEAQAADAKAAETGAEERVNEAEKAKAWAETTADEMQALEVDAAVLGAMADHLSNLDAAKTAEDALLEAVTAAYEAWLRVGESAQNVASQLDASGHGGVQEARENAANGGAAKEFYEAGR